MSFSMNVLMATVSPTSGSVMYLMTVVTSVMRHTAVMIYIAKIWTVMIVDTITMATIGVDQYQLGKLLIALLFS